MAPLIIDQSTVVRTNDTHCTPTSSSTSPVVTAAHIFIHLPMILGTNDQIPPNNLEPYNLITANKDTPGTPRIAQSVGTPSRPHSLLTYLPNLHKAPESGTQRSTPHESTPGVRAKTDPHLTIVFWPKTAFGPGLHSRVRCMSTCRGSDALWGSSEGSGRVGSCW